MHRVPLKPILALLVLVVAIAIPVAVSIHRSNQAVAEWKAALSVERVKGKSARELVERFGEPKSMERDPPTGVVLNMLIEGPDGNYCQIEFENDRAAKVTFWSR